MKRSVQATLSLGGSMRLVPAARSPLAVPPPAGQPDAAGPMELAAKRARTEVEAEQQVSAAKPVVPETKPPQKIKKEVTTHVPWVKVNLRILYGGIAIAADLAITKITALAAEGMKHKRILYTPKQKESAISKTSSLSLKPAQAAKLLNAVAGYEKLDRSTMARGGSTTARKFAIVPSRRARSRERYF